jgi:calcineurin-like phosphoesterase family protein
LTRDLWVISDTHFNHENILHFTDHNGDRIRPFDSVKEMNEVLVNRWNSVVKPGDIVYHLGDVFLGPQEDFKALWPRLNGSKRLVVGNHDNLKFLVPGGFFKKVTMWRQMTDFGLLLTHVPIHSSALSTRSRKGLLNVHGHIHAHPAPEGDYHCVCVEQTNYTPVNLEEIRAK